MKKISLIILLILSSAIFAQNKTHKHYLGAHAGSVSGLGFSYRYWPNKFGGQFTFIPVLKKGGNYFISSGVSLLYTLKEGKHVDLYSYLGFHLINTKNTSVIYDPIDPTKIYNKITTYNNIYNTGVGIGFKFKLFNVLDFCLQGGYGMYDIRKNYLNKASFELNMAGGIGLYYKL